MSPRSTVHRTACAIHIHTRYSDGSATIEEIVATARSCGLDALMITDHHTMSAARHGWQGWHDDILVIVGYEHSDPHDRNHLLVFGLEEPLDPTLSPEDYVTEARRAGAVVFIAHPLERRSGTGLKSYPWTAGFDLPVHGLEVWNFMSLWAERFTPRRALLNYVFPSLAGERIDGDTLALWDRLAASNSMVGIAGLDAHALKIPWGPMVFTLFPHARHFQGPLTVIETPVALSRIDARADTDLLMHHLISGNASMGITRHGPLREISAQWNGEERQVWGETLYGVGGILRVDVPRRACIRLVRNNRPVGEHAGITATFALADSGTYRVEIWRRGALWLLTNHFRVAALSSG